MSYILKNPREAIGHKIVWHSWPNDGTYFLLEDVKDKFVYGNLYDNAENTRTEKRERFYLSKGIRTKSKPNERREASCWYLIEDLKTYKIDDELFEI